MRSGLIMVVLWLFARANANAVASMDGPKIQDQPPALTLSKVLQAPSNAATDWASFAGKVVVLEFWATWCGPCIQAIPHMNELAGAFSQDKVQFIAITDENEAVVRQFLKKTPINAWIGLDAFGKTKQDFGIMGIPHTVLIGKDGRIAAVTHPTFVETRHIQELIEGKPSSLPAPQIHTPTKDLAVERAEAPPLFEISIKNFVELENPHGPTCAWTSLSNRCEIQGELATVESALRYFCSEYGIWPKIKTPLPAGYYDFRFALPTEDRDLLKQLFYSAIQTSFGLALKETEETETVYELKLAHTNAPGLVPVQKRGGGGGFAGGFKLRGCPISTVVDYLVHTLKRPVIDKTNLAGLFEVNVKWNMSEAELLPGQLPSEVWESLEQLAKANPGKAPEELPLPSNLLRNQSPATLERALKEIAKPESERFAANPEAVIEAVRAHLGLELVQTERKIKVLLVDKR